MNPATHPGYAVPRHRAAGTAANLRPAAPQALCPPANGRFHRISSAASRRLASACLTCLLLPAAALAFDPAPPANKPRDLTDMSLEDLLHEDVVPINVLGNHTHRKGEIMVGYSCMFTEMAHNQNGTRDVSEAEVLQSYPIVHTRMTMQTHMIDLMYAPSVGPFSRVLKRIPSLPKSPSS